MYHILPAQRQAQFRAGKRANNERDTSHSFGCRLKLSSSVYSRISRFNHDRGRFSPANLPLDPIETQNEIAGTPGEAKIGQHALHQAGFRARGQIA